MGLQMLRPRLVHVDIFNLATRTRIRALSLTLIIALLTLTGCTQMYTADLNELVEQDVSHRQRKQGPIDPDRFTVDPELFEQLPPQHQADAIGVTDTQTADTITQIPATFDTAGIAIDQSVFEAPLTPEEIERLSNRRTESLPKQLNQVAQEAGLQLRELNNKQAKPSTAAKTHDDAKQPIVLKALPSTGHDSEEQNLSVTPLPPQDQNAKRLSHARLVITPNPLTPVVSAHVTEPVARPKTEIPQQLIARNSLQPLYSEAENENECDCGSAECESDSAKDSCSDFVGSISKTASAAVKENDCCNDFEATKQALTPDQVFEEIMNQVADQRTINSDETLPELQTPEPQQLIDQMEAEWIENAPVANSPQLPGEMPNPAQIENQSLPVPKSTDVVAEFQPPVQEHPAPSELASLHRAMVDAATIDESQIQQFQVTKNDFVQNRAATVPNEKAQPKQETQAETKLESVSAAISSVAINKVEPIANIARIEKQTIQAAVPVADLKEPEAPKPISWDRQLANTIDAFETQIQTTSDDIQRNDLKSGLNILQSLQARLAADDEVDFFQSPQHRDYWDHQIQALTELLDHSASANDLTGTASRAVSHLQQAVMQLRDLANLNMAVVVFCTKVAGYGQYVPVRSVEFEPGQKTLIYCELENFLPIQETIGEQTIYRTRLRSRFNVLDSTGSVVQQADFPIVEDVARNRRRDFYMHLPVTIGNLEAGKYRLYLTIEDLSGNKTATLDSPLVFSVK